jgi:hypothetical protein
LRSAIFAIFDPNTQRRERKALRPFLEFRGRDERARPKGDRQ